ncbi:MAG: hypothetical protein ACLTTJ_14170 [Blautia sp.]
MKKIKWGVMGTAFIWQSRRTFPGMLRAENFARPAQLRGKKYGKSADQFKENMDLRKHMGVTRSC